MTPERWQEIRNVLEKALELAPEERSAFLNRACSSDKSLRQEVETLLASNDDVRSSFLQFSRWSSNADDPDATGTSEVGQIFAQRFHLVRKLGEGGMGEVWLAEQISPVQRQVALKLIKSGTWHEGIAQRFQSERQSLAIMDHPAIAKVFDAGATPQGQPYFVMEYVPGLPITDYCDQKKLKIKDRLELFIQACEGAQHAHQKAIIHRDLKPANILVTEVDGKAVPRIIDFGLAKATTPRDADESAFTQVGHFVGTPGYMSPEQADPNVRDIDTRTDVYSLGVVLYVLLTGLQPFETRKRQKQPLDEVLRRLREEEPPLPSAKFSGDRETSTATAEARGTEPKQLLSLLRGDLDCITVKALEKDRSRRYAAPSELAADIRRYLNHEPVLARRPSLAYRAGKFIKRNKLAVALTSVGAAVLLAGALAILHEVRVAKMQETRAERRFESLRKLTNSLLFEFHDSIEKLPGSTEARDLVLRRAMEYLDQIAAEAPGDQAILQDLAAGYERVARIRGEEQQPHLGGPGSFQQARELYEKALSIRQRLADANPRDISLQLDLLETMLYVATVNYELGDLDRALDVHQRRLKIEEQLAAKDSSEDLKYNIAESMIGIGVLEFYYGDYNSAVDYERKALALNQALLDANPTSIRIRRRVAISHDWLANALRLDAKYADSAEEDRKALSIIEQLTAADRNNTDLQRFVAGYNEEFCRCLAYAGLLSEARPHCRKSIAMNEKMMQSDKSDVQAVADVASSNASMGLLLYLMHSPQQALPFERRADVLYRDVMVRDPESIQNGVDYARSLVDSGRIEADLHHPELARKELAQAQQILRRWIERSPKSRPIQNTLDEDEAVLSALPNDTVAVLPH